MNIEINGFAFMNKVYCLDSKVHAANMGPTWVLSAPDGPHVGPMNLAIRVVKQSFKDLKKVIIIM